MVLYHPLTFCYRLWVVESWQYETCWLEGRSVDKQRRDKISSRSGRASKRRVERSAFVAINDFAHNLTIPLASRLFTWIHVSLYTNIGIYMWFYTKYLVLNFLWVQIFQLVYQGRQYFDWSNLLEWLVFTLAIVYVAAELDVEWFSSQRRWRETPTTNCKKPAGWIEIQIQQIVFPLHVQCCERMTVNFVLLVK